MPPSLPEILAPAGDEECLRAAVGAGADAVYFGLSSGFNARANTTNFAPDELPRVMGFLHERGVKGYVAFNTVVYDAELAVAERLLGAIARAGADAVIVQDLGVARLCHALAPTLPIHASTQMTISSPEGAAVARSLGVVRIILPRELSIEEIRRMRAGTRGLRDHRLRSVPGRQSPPGDPLAARLDPEPRSEVEHPCSVPHGGGAPLPAGMNPDGAPSPLRGNGAPPCYGASRRSTSSVFPASFTLASDLELECFVHGALCVSWSGQCLTSEAWGARSANRGQCAQSCRLPYDLVVDGRIAELGLEKYLLSPKDLGAFNLLPELWEAGISCFKIEGRYKGPDYVAATVEKYRLVVDALGRGEKLRLGREDQEELALTYSRGFSPGWLLGDDHQELSHGLHPAHRGLRVGPVERVSGFRVYVRPEPGAPELKAGHWMVFDQGRPEEDAPQGGTFAVEPEKDGLIEVRFGDPGPDLSRVRPGDILWKSHDSALKRRLLRAIDADRKVWLDLRVRGRAGAPLEVEAEDVFARRAAAASEAPLEPARRKPLGEPHLRQKLGALGDTRYFLRRLDVALDGDLAISPAELKRVRRRLVAALEAQPIPAKTHEVRPGARAWATAGAGATAAKNSSVSQESIYNETRTAQEGVVAVASGQAGTPLPAAPGIIPLCRTRDQVEAMLAAGVSELYLDFMELEGLSEAVRRCKTAGARVIVATPRVQKPGEEPIDRRFEALAPDGILARHLGALHHYAGRVRAGEAGAFTLHGDFSLNAANAVTGRLLLDHGLATLTPSYDLNVAQLEEMAAGLPVERLEVTLHQHLPLYHTEYCLYAHNLSGGKDFRDCGRPCDTHRAALRDGKGLEHPVLVDVNCRNTVFNARAQSAAQHLPRLQACGIRRFRVELVWETGEEAARVLGAYRDLLAGTRSTADVARALGAIERYGVTSGTLAMIR